MISPYVKLLRGRHAGTMFKDLPPTYSEWISEQCSYDQERIKNCDISLGGKRISELNADALEHYNSLDTLTTWQNDIIKSYLTRPSIKGLDALGSLIGQ